MPSTTPGDSVGAVAAPARSDAPAASGAGAPATAESVRTSDDAAHYVIVMDHVLLRHGLAEALRRNPRYHNAGEFSSVSAGVDACSALAPSFAITAWSLPDGRGDDLARQCAGKGVRTRFILVASESGAHIVRRAFDAGVQGCLLRRATFEMLEEAIAAVLSGRTYYCPESSRLLIEALRNTSPGEGKTLSPREREILVGLVHGEAPKMLAYRLGLSPKTVNNQLWALKDKLGIHDMAGLVRFAMRCGLAEE